MSEQEPFQQRLLFGGIGGGRGLLVGFGEVQGHDSAGQRELNERVIGLPVGATHDLHFLSAGDAEAHDVLLCIGLGRDKGGSFRAGPRAPPA